jgi:hypothetical protein
VRDLGSARNVSGALSDLRSPVLCYDAYRNYMDLRNHAMSQTSEKQTGSPRWGPERRLEFVDFRLRWERTVNRGELVDFFRISTPQASADLAHYAQLAPENMSYDASLKTYRATASFKPAFAVDDAQEYLGELSALSAEALAPSGSFIGWQPPHDVVRVPGRPVSTDILLPILWAIRDRDELKISYQSMRRPSPTIRWIAPHALGFDGHRWHARAWCYENDDFRDFVISRIRAVRGVRDTTADGSSDAWWHTYVDLLIRPRKRLTEGQRRAVERDFGMTRGRLKLACRKALAFYLLRQLRLDRVSDQPAVAQPLELMNRGELADVIIAAQKAPERTVISITESTG